MIYREGITINGVHSYADYDLVINSRSIGVPEKRSIRKTIPYMNGFYDFSLLGGKASWGAREISYTFDIIGETVEKMDRKRTEVLNWLCNLHDVDIYDDSIPDYHFHGSFDSVSQSEEGEKSEITFTFICYPFMIANLTNERVIYEPAQLSILNSGMEISPYISSVQACSVSIGGKIQSVSAGANIKMGVLFEHGENSVNLSKSNEIIYPYRQTTRTENGITFTDNKDGTITANGTSTGVALFYVRGASEGFNIPIGRHFMRGCPANVGTNKYRLQLATYDGTGADPSYYFDYGNGVEFEITSEIKSISIGIMIVSGYTADNLVFNPKLYGATTVRWVEEVI